MAPRKKLSSKTGKKNFSQEEISILGRIRRLEDDPETGDIMEKRLKGKGGKVLDDIWDEPSVYDDPIWDDEDETEFF